MSTFSRLMRQPLARRILASTGSNVYAQVTTMGIQLLSLPLFLSHWNLATYGDWLVLSAVPAYLAMADVGIVTAAGNRMTMLMGEGRARQATQVFQSALAFLLSVCGLALLLLGAGLMLWQPGSVATTAARTTIALLSVGVMATLFGGLPEAVYKATERYALGNALSNTTRLFEWLGSLVGLWWGGDFIAVALGALLPRLLFTAGMALHAARSSPSIRWGFADASKVEIRRCVGPAVSFMAFPAANAVNFQGLTLVAASVLGPGATVVFNTYRTMSRVTVQATATFSHALWPEFSRIFGRGDLQALGALYRRSWWLGAALAAIASVIVYFAAPVVFRVWSKGQIEFSPSLMVASMGYAAAAGAWHVSRVLLLSTNEHKALAWPYLAASALCVPVAWLAARAFGLMGLMTTMLALELLMFVFCSELSRRLLATPPRAEPIGVAT